ncbi:MAG: peptidyl-prolyl cis-trans isomerase [Vulcanibacillus sp.]
MRKDRILILIIAILLIIIIIGYLWFDGELNKENAVAVVNGQEISEKEFLETLKKEYGKEVLEDLIDKMVINEAAKKYGIVADQVEMDRQYNEFMKDYETEEEFMVYLETQMGWTKDGLLDFIEYYTLWEEIATKDINVSEDEVLAFYEANKSRYSIPENFHLQQIVVNTKEEANQVVDELKAGSDFNTLAKERSIDFLSISSGGDLGRIYVNDPSVDPTIINKAKTMAINEIAVIQMGEYYAVIQLLANNKELQYSYDEVKSEIRREIALSQAKSLPIVLEQLKEDMNLQIIDSSLKNN